MKNPRTLWTVLGLTFVGFAIGGGEVAAQNDPDQTRGEDGETVVQGVERTVTLTVVNDNWLDMKIYALRLGTRYRLGTVTSLTSEEFELPAHLQPSISEVQLLAVPIGGTHGVVSPTVYPSGGDEVVWALQNNLALSGTIVS